MAFVVGFSGESPGTIIQFVDSIQENPGVRLVLNDFNPFYAIEANWSPPPLRRSTTSSMLADGDTVTGSRHGNREITLTLKFKTANQDVAAEALSLLAAELERDNNILMVQHGSRPTFFRTYRSSDYQLAMLNHDIDYAQQTLTLMAEPYALGLPVVAVLGQDVDPDPANGGEFLDINGVLGDVETPLLIQILGPAGVLAGTSVMTVRRGGDPSQLAHWIQAEDCSPGYDTTPSGLFFDDDSGLNPGPGGNFLRCTFASQPGMNNRFEWVFPNFPNVDARGAYRLFVRARPYIFPNADGTQITMQASYNGAPLLTRNPGVPAVVPNDGNQGSYVIDLGTFHAPTGPDPVTFGYSNQVMPVDAGVISVQAARLSGAATLDIDYAFMVPVDDQFVAITWDPTVPSNTWAVLDGPAGAIYQITGSVDTFGQGVVPIETPSSHGYRGELPVVSPGVNRLYFIASAFTAAYAPDVIGSPPATLTVTYWPRYLALATA